MFERYTDAAKRAIFLARIEANHRDAPFISAEYILIGLTWESTPQCADLAKLKENAVALRAQLGVPHLPSTCLPYLRDRQIGLDDSVKKALAHASREADAEKQYWIDRDHLLRGLLSFQNTAGDALNSLGITLHTVRADVAAYRRHSPPNPAPRWRKLRTLASRHRALLEVIAVAIALLMMLLVVKLRDPI